MKLYWKQRNKIEFFHSEPSIIETFPIIESKDLKLNWVKKVKKHFEEASRSGEVNSSGFSHLVRCPGIFDLFKYGYIVPLHKDIIIKPNGKEDRQSGKFVLDRYDDAGFDFFFADFPSLIPDGLASPIWDTSGFAIESLKKQIMHLLAKPSWTADFIIKIVTGWHVIVPKGVKFLMLPIAYPDTFDFTSTIGIFDPAQSTNINFQMLWNATEPETIIKAGTPLGHLIPLSEKKYKMVQRIMNQQDRDWIIKANSARHGTFWQHTMRNKIVAMYNKYWHGIKYDT